MMISLTLGDMTTLYSGRIGLARLSAVTTAIFLMLFAILFGAWWAIGRTSGVEGVASSLIANEQVRTGVAEKLIDQVTNGAGSDIKTVVAEKKDLLVKAVSDALASPEISAETKKIIDDVYGYFTGEKTNAEIDVKVLIKPILQSMSSVDPAFKADDIDTSTIEPIKLGEDGNTPNLAPFKSILAVAVFSLFLLLVLSIFGLAKFTKTKNHFVGVIGWQFSVIGILLIAIFLSVPVVIKSIASTANDALVSSALPVIAQSALGMFRLEGILLLIVGLIGIITWARARKAQPQL